MPTLADPFSAAFAGAAGHAGSFDASRSSVSPSTPAVPATTAPTAPTPSPALPYAHREAYGAHFLQLARNADAAGAAEAALTWRRLLTYLDADIDGADRVALWQALWQLGRRLPDGTRLRLAAQLDGRHALRLAPLTGHDWADPSLIAHLAHHGCTSRQAAIDFVPALLTHHGLDPLAAPATHPPALVLAATAAELAGCAQRLAAERIEHLHQAIVVACAAEPSGLPQGLALLFDLALHAGDEVTAVDTLAELVRHGHADAVSPSRVAAWLDGSAFIDDAERAQPLQLGPALQPAWLRLADWQRPARLAQLTQALQRPAPRLRLLTLAERLQLPQVEAPALDRTLHSLQTLDAAYAMADDGLDPAPALPILSAPGVLAPAALAALHRSCARFCAARGDDEGELLALLQARRLQSSPALRAAIARALPAPAPVLGPDWQTEQDLWVQLAQQGAPAYQRLAAFQLATLWTAGQWEPKPTRRCAQRLDDAHALWTWLAEDPRYTALAQAELRDVPQRLMRPALRHDGGIEHLWFERLAGRAVMVVFACVATHHSHAEVATLQRQLPGHHLLFINCPDKNWYCDERYEQVQALLQQQVARRFAPGQVSCWYGSMGGHAALKFALAFGWRAIVFNPQTDLDLWAAFRPTERALLWGSQRHRQLADGRAEPWQQVPLYYACGAATADREALSWLIERLRRCPHLSAVIEKFADANHAGLMARIAAGPVAPALARIERRLDELAAPAPLAGAQPLEGDAAAAFWDRLDAARALKVEIQVRDGRLWWQPSLACGTR